MKYVICILASLFLTTCYAENNPQDLLAHPTELRQLIEDCQITATQTSSDARCANLYAILPVLNQAANDPEAFGQQILELEMAVAKLQAEELALQQKSSSAASKLALQQAQEKQQALQQQIALDLAVIGANSPE